MFNLYHKLGRGNNPSTAPYGRKEKEMENGADITTKIYVGKDTYISMSSKTFYNYKNTIKVEDENGVITPCRFVPLGNSECWLLVPDKLVPRVVTPTVVERKNRRKSK